MPLPASGTLSLSQIATEFNRTPPLAMSSLYGIVSGVPISGSMSISDFYGKSAGVLTSSYTMTVASQRNAADGKFVTEPNTFYGFSSSVVTLGNLVTRVFRNIPITDIAYMAYDNGKKRLIVTFGYGYTYQADGTPIPVTLAKRIVFSTGQSFNLSQVASTVEPLFFYTWSAPTVGTHNKTTFTSGYGYVKNLQYVIDLSAAPFPLSGNVGVTLEYD